MHFFIKCKLPKWAFLDSLEECLVVSWRPNNLCLYRKSPTFWFTFLLTTKYLFVEDIFLNCLLRISLQGVCLKRMYLQKCYIAFKHNFCHQKQMQQWSQNLLIEIVQIYFYFAFWPVSVVQPSNVVKYRWRIRYFLLIPTKVIHTNSILW